VNLEAQLNDEDLELFDQLSLTDLQADAEAGNLTPIQSGLTDPDRIGAAPSDPLISLTDVIRQLNQLHLKDQLNHLSRSLKQAEALGKDATDLKQEFTQVVKKMAKEEKK